jgi:hypothetical protein
MTSITLTRAAALALAVAGLIFIAIQPLHPHEDIAGITSQTWVVVHLLSWTMAALGLAGITAVYLAQVRRFGVLGLLGYLVFSLFFLIQACVNFTEAFVLPLSAAGSPRLTEDVASLFVSGYALQTDVGPLAIVGSIGGLLYLGGAVLFGVAVVRAHLLPRWTGIVLIAAALASLSAAVLPHELARYAAVPMGVALTAMGVALFLQQRSAVVPAADARLAPVAA